MQYILEYKEWVERYSELDEDWSVGDWAHLFTDVVSAVADSVVPGAGSIIDIIHAISYFIQSDATEGQLEKMSLNLQGVVTLGSVVAIGAFQAAAVSFKSEIKIIVDAFKKGAGQSVINLAKSSAGKAAGHANQILKLLQDVAKWLGSKIKSIANSEVGKWLLSKFGSLQAAETAITKYLTVSVPNTIKQFISMLAKLNPTAVGAHAAGGEAEELALKQVAKAYTISQSSNLGLTVIAQTTQNTNQQIAQLKQPVKPKAKV
jgi:hypothetical protein